MITSFLALPTADITVDGIAVRHDDGRYLLRLSDSVTVFLAPDTAARVHAVLGAALAVTQ